MTFSQAEQYLYQFSSHKKIPKAMLPLRKKRMRAILAHLGNPENSIPHYIHITGTSGKGSLTAYLHEILRQDKKKVGSMISPHLTTITERWRVDGAEMDKKTFVLLVKKLKKAVDAYLLQHTYGAPNFFELTTIIGFLFFEKEQIEWAVVEAGIGAAHDSTNIMKRKDIAVITNIGIDHTSLLGNTKRKIAINKAGIICAPCTVFTQEKEKSLRHIFLKKAKQQHAQFRYIPSYKKGKRIITPSGQSFSYKDAMFTIQGIGAHQVNNAVLAIEIAAHLGIPATSIKKGLRHAALPGRFEILSRSPNIIIDSAHNEDKILSTLASLKELQNNDIMNKNIVLLIGMSKKNDVEQMINQLMAISPSHIICTSQHINPFCATASLDMLKRYITRQGNIPVTLESDPKKALIKAKKLLGAQDTLLITGSCFIAGELRPRLTRHPAKR